MEYLRGLSQKSFVLSIPDMCPISILIIEFILNLSSEYIFLFNLEYVLLSTIAF